MFFNVNSAINFRRVTHFRLCLPETQVTIQPNDVDWSQPGPSLRITTKPGPDSADRPHKWRDSGGTVPSIEGFKPSNVVSFPFSSIQAILALYSLGEI